MNDVIRVREIGRFRSREFKLLRRHFYLFKNMFLRFLMFYQCQTIDISSFNNYKLSRTQIKNFENYRLIIPFIVQNT